MVPVRIDNPGVRQIQQNEGYGQLINVFYLRVNPGLFLTNSTLHTPTLPVVLIFSCCAVRLHRAQSSLRCYHTLSPLLSTHMPITRWTPPHPQPYLAPPSPHSENLRRIMGIKCIFNSLSDREESRNRHCFHLSPTELSLLSPNPGLPSPPLTHHFSN